MKREKTTFYMEPELLNILEAERLDRIKAGTRRSECDLSDLVNEAVRRTFGGTPKAAGQMRALRRMSEARGKR